MSGTTSSSTIFWNPQSLKSKSTTIEDDRWLVTYNEFINPVSQLIVKTGTREFSLETKSKTWNSEGALKRKYSSLWPCRNAFCVMSLIDASKRYSVTTRQIFDLDFFFTFFGNAEFTINNIIDKTEVVCEKWNEKYSGRPELAEERCPISEYIEAAQHTIKRRNGEEIRTKLIVIISTYHFTRINETTECPTIYPTDCTIQFKYSSTEFIPLSEEETLDNSGYNFDKNGLIFPYAVFLNLLKSKKFHNYIQQCVEQKLRDEADARKRKLHITEQAEENLPFKEPPPTFNVEEDEEDIVPLKKKRSKGSVVEGAVKKFKVPHSPAAVSNEAEIEKRLSEAVKAIGGSSSSKK